MHNGDRRGIHAAAPVRLARCETKEPKLAASTEEGFVESLGAVELEGLWFNLGFYEAADHLAKLVMLFGRSKDVANTS